MIFRRSYHGVQVSYIEPGRAAFTLAGRRYDASKTTVLRERLSTWRVMCRETSTVLVERATLSDAIRWMLDEARPVPAQYQDETDHWDKG